MAKAIGAVHSWCTLDIYKYFHDGVQPDGKDDNSQILRSCLVHMSIEKSVVGQAVHPIEEDLHKNCQ